MNIDCPKQLTYTLTLDDDAVPAGMFANTTKTIKTRYTVRSHLRTHQDWPNLLRQGEVRVGCEYTSPGGGAGSAFYIKTRDTFRFCRRIGGERANKWDCER